MKINNITSTDYHLTDGELHLIMTGTTLDEITSMDTALVTVRTDAGDLVESFAGYALQSVTYTPESGNYEAVLVQAVKDNTSDVLNQLVNQVDDLTKKLNKLQNDSIGAVKDSTAAMEATKVANPTATMTGNIDNPAALEAIKDNAGTIEDDGARMKVMKAVSNDQGTATDIPQTDQEAQ